jgi:hypothetical protein
MYKVQPYKPSLQGVREMIAFAAKAPGFRYALQGLMQTLRPTL